MLNKQIQPVMRQHHAFFSLPPQLFSLLSGLVGVLLTQNLDINQQNSLGNFLVGVGQGLLTAAAQGATLQSSSTKDQRIQEQMRMLKNQIKLLEQEINENH